ncbi:hypothetical protein KC19_6G144100 [Ceratodon purpureus]|nr:hypothetical protein KC19_6G144100 [Ceratodon purpureus]
MANDGEVVEAVESVKTLVTEVAGTLKPAGLPPRMPKAENGGGEGIKGEFDMEELKDSEGAHDAERLVVVANRLPLNVERKGCGQWQLEERGGGGLVSALRGAKSDMLWIGWAGLEVKDKEGQRTLTEALKLQGCIPVFLDSGTLDLYYHGFSNSVLWPLFHYLGLPQSDTLDATTSLDAQYAAYQQANKAFADVVMSTYQKGDVIWCHDYHLMFLPKYLKETNPHIKVGWFLHTPFPSSEIYRTLSLRSEILEALLKADLIGFHTYDYARHFESSCIRILGLEGTPEGVENDGRVTRVSAFPVGIDAGRFIDSLETPAVKQELAYYQDQFSGKKVLLGVDRLDMIKGIPQKLLAFEMFLEKCQEWRGKVVLVQIAVPSRTDSGVEYQRLAKQVHEIVGRINGAYCTFSWTPIRLLDKLLKHDELCALYACTDVGLMTSLRDGMNLTAYEFIACQHQRQQKGVLVLSEFAGAAQSLGAGALLVNPWNVREVYTAILEALTMSEFERNERHQQNYKHVTTHTAEAWASNYIRELNDTIEEDELRTLRIPPSLPADDAVRKFQRGKTRLLIVGFNVTISAPVDAPRRRGDQIRELNLGLHPGMKEPLTKLCQDPNTIILILSGSTKEALDETFGDYNLWLAAENGMFLRHTSGLWNTNMKQKFDMDWAVSVKLVFEYFCARAPRTFVESRETALVWNYKYADVEFGRLQARDMLQHLWTGPYSNAAVDIIQGSKSVEVRPVGVTKGATMGSNLIRIAESKGPDFKIDYLLCIGHFLSKDEDVFTFLDPEPRTQRDYSYRKMENTKDRLRMENTKDRLRVNGGRGKSMELTSNSRPSKWSLLRTKTFPSTLPEPDSVEALDAIIDVSKDTYFSCAVGRKRSTARYSLPSSDEVVLFFKALADAL